MRRQQRIISLFLVVILSLQPLPAAAKGRGGKAFKEVRKEKYGEDILHFYEHPVSGLEVVWIENDDVNKAFALGVKTPTTDDTGVNHIIEHTVFTGSKNYPSASLFFDANEAYPCTYMNALTSGDMTVYPFATPYEACFNALLPIYLDAIFNPNLLRTPYGFYEESFHSVPPEKRCGGVVYNEMKGACSGLDRAIYRQIRGFVFEDSHYSYDSGGDPAVIPTLTYEQCVETYHKYYYPANMKIILYGDLAIDEALMTIASYVTDKVKDRPGVDLSVSGINDEEYGTFKVLPKGNKGTLVKVFALDKTTSASTLQALDLWMTAYLMSSQSRLQMGLREMGLQSKWLKDDDVPYPIYALVINEIEPEQMEKCSKMIDHLLNGCMERKKANCLLEQDMLREMRWLFEKQDESNHRGVNIAQSILDGWAHQREEEQYFINKERLMKMGHINLEMGELLLDKAQRYTLYLLPGEKEDIDPLRLTPISPEKWQQIYDGMKKWQSQKSDLTPVKLEQLVIGVKDLPTITKRSDHWTMETRTDTKLVRSQLYINTSHLAQKDLKFLFLYSYLLEQSAKDITPFSGNLNTCCTAYPLKEGYWPCFRLAITSLPEEVQHGVLFNQARAGLLERPESWYKQKLYELVMGMKASSTNNAISTLASLSMAGRDEQSSYLYQSHYPWYSYCQELLTMPNMQWVEEVKKIDGKLYHKGGLILSTTLNKKGKNLYAADWEKVIDNFECLPNLKGTYDLQVPKEDCLVKTEGAVDYSFKTLYKADGITGTDYVVAACLTKNYLNPLLRVKLGSYGAGCQVYDPKTIGMYAYRTPDYEKALEVISGSAAYFDQMDEHMLEKSKAEAMSKVHEQYKLLGTPLEKAAAVEQLILWGRSPKEIVNLQKEILLTTNQSIKEKKKLYEELINKGKNAVMTGKQYTNVQNFTIYKY